ALVKDEEEIVAWTPGPAQPAVETDLTRDVVVLHERVPSQIGCKRDVHPRAYDPDIEVAFGQANLAQVVGGAGGKKAGWPPVDLRPITAPGAAVVVAEA